MIVDSLHYFVVFTWTPSSLWLSGDIIVMHVLEIRQFLNKDIFNILMFIIVTKGFWSKFEKHSFVDFIATVVNKCCCQSACQKAPPFQLGAHRVFSSGFYA